MAEPNYGQVDVNERVKLTEVHFAKLGCNKSELENMLIELKTIYKP